MSRLRNKKVEVPTLGSDREIARRENPLGSAKENDVLAARRSMARMIASEEKNTIRALDVLTAEVPRATIQAWVEQRLKAA